MPADIQTILRIEVPVIVQIAAHEMPVRSVMSLSPGAIIELPKLVTDDLDILVGDKAIAVGRAVKVGENFGIRIKAVGDLAARTEAMNAWSQSGGEKMSQDEIDVEALAAQLLNGQ